jgi:hypothetical protein
MPAPHVVLRTPPRSSHLRRLLSRQHPARVSPLAATLMNLPTNVANKRLTAGLSPLDATLTRKRGISPSGQIFSPPAAGSCPQPPIFRTHFQVPYPATPLFATLMKTAGVWGYSSHFGTTSFRSVLQCLGGRSFLNASSTGAAMMSRTRSRNAGTSSFDKPLVSLVSCR